MITRAPLRAARRTPGRAVVAVLTATLAVGVLALGGPSVANAASTTMATPPVPAGPTFSSVPESLAHYEAGDTCDPIDKPGALKLAALIRQTYGSDQVIGISRASDCSALPSEHAEGRAVDWMLNASNAHDLATAKTFLHWLLAKDADGNRYAMARRLGVMYIIWNKRMWRAYDPSRGWAPYTGSVPHTDHIHISLSLDGASGRTSFWTDHTLADPCVNAPVSGSATPSAQPALYVPVDPTRVLVTNSGHGTATGGPCRLWASADRVDATVTGVAGLAPDGVEAVALSVTAGPSNSKANLSAGPTGVPGAKVRRLTLAAGPAATSLIVVPVGADGRVSFWTSRGATDLSVSVVGYYVAATTPGLKRATAGTAGELHRVRDHTLLDAAAIDGHATTTLDIPAETGIPATATAAVVTLTAGSLDTGGTVSVLTHGGALRSAPGVVVGPGQRHTVTAMVPLASDGTIDVVNRSRTAKQVSVHLIAYYRPGAGAGGLQYRWRAPRQVIATARGVGFTDIAKGSQTLDLSSWLDPAVRCVVLQVTVTGGRRASSLGFYDPDGTNPKSPAISVGRHETLTTTVIAPVSAAGQLSVWDSHGRVRMTASVVGTFRTP